MTDKELEKLGIYNVSTKNTKKRYGFKDIDGEYTIPEHYNIMDIFLMFRSIGYELGIEEGKRKKIEEVKHVLEIPYK